MKNIIIVEEIQTLYKEYCEEIGINYSEKNFDVFLDFLEVDKYDWINENLRQFDRSKQS